MPLKTLRRLDSTGEPGTTEAGVRVKDFEQLGEENIAITPVAGG